MVDENPGPAFDAFFGTWNGDGEGRWAEYAWSRVREPALDPHDPTDRLTDLVRLLSLGALTMEFHAHAFREGATEDWRHCLAAPVEAAGLGAVTAGRTTAFEWITEGMPL